MGNAVLVTLANFEYLSYAKQLYSSVYHSQSWEGDCVLLFDGLECDELNWFKERNIEVYCVGTDFVRKPWDIRFSLTTLCKFYLFTPYFSRWDRVVYLDCDVIVRGSLQYLRSSSSVFLAGNNFSYTLSSEFSSSAVCDELSLLFNMNLPSFCSGVMSFNTSIIDDNTFSELVSLYNQYGDFVVCAEQGILNLYFCELWEELPFRFHVCPNQMQRYISYPKYIHFSSSSFNGSIIHFLAHPKPWDPGSDFYSEWSGNLHSSDEIYFSNNCLDIGESLFSVFLSSKFLLFLRSFSFRNFISSL